MRVSGDWLVWACRIPARGSDDVPGLPLQLVPQVSASLGCSLGFLCCVPTTRVLNRLKNVPLSPCAAPLGAAVRGGPQSVRRVPLLARLGACGVVGPRWHARPLGCGKLSGHEASGPYLSRNKAFYASCERRPPLPWSGPSGSGHAASASARNATWLILPVVICLSQRLSHACVRMN